MNVSLTRELERFVAKKVKSGMYQTASEVVREGLRRMQEREKQLEKLRKEVRIGIDQADRGEVAPLDFKALMAKVRRRLRPKARAG